MCIRDRFTLPHPAVAGVDGIAAERRDRALVGPHRRMRPTPLGHPALQLLGSPAPRPAVSERLEPAQRALALVDQRRAEPTTDLLSPPARQHLLEQRRLRRQRRGVVGQRQDSPRRLHSGLPSCRHWLPHRGGEGNATGCRILASGASAARHPRSAGVSDAVPTTPAHHPWTAKPVSTAGHATCRVPPEVALDATLRTTRWVSREWRSWCRVQPPLAVVNISAARR